MATMENINLKIVKRYKVLLGDAKATLGIKNRNVASKYSPGNAEPQLG